MQQTNELLGKDSPEKIKRCREIQDFLDGFITRWNSLETAVRIRSIENAAKKITDKYFELLETTIREYLHKNSYSNKFKVASGTEIATMFVLPINIEDPSYTFMEKKEINAIFGMELSIQLLYQIHYEEGKSIPQEKSTNEKLAKIFYNHRWWLSRLNISNLQNTPTFINSNFWEAYFYASTGEV